MPVQTILLISVDIMCVIDLRLVNYHAGLPVMHKGSQMTTQALNRLSPNPVGSILPLSIQNASLLSRTSQHKFSSKNAHRCYGFCLRLA